MMINIKIIIVIIIINNVQYINDIYVDLIIGCCGLQLKDYKRGKIIKAMSKTFEK